MRTEWFAELQNLIGSDHRRMRVLDHVRDLGLPDCWVAAGFVRNCVWDYLHQRSTSPLPQDVDVIWYDPKNSTSEHDAVLEMALLGRDSSLKWSVKNQARMHQRNGDGLYRSASDAMRHWPETATAVGVRLNHLGNIEVSAPFGLDDLFDLIVRPTQRFVTEKHPIYLQRIRSKHWATVWPNLKIETLC